MKIVPAVRKQRPLFDAIKHVLAEHPEGLPLAQIQKHLGHTGPSLPTIIRALKKLTTSGELLKQGQSRAAVYKPAVAASAAAINVLEPTLSPDAKQLRALVSQPLHQRTPVGYSPHFLADYRPNETFYLHEEQRRQLAQLGRTTPSHAAAGTYVPHIVDRLLIDLSWNSSRLEGNTYSLLDTHRLLATGALAERFIEFAERELINLTEGNFARYPVTKAQFDTWHARWAKDPAVPA